MASIIDNHLFTSIEPQYMMATLAYHNLCNMSNPEHLPDLCVVREENPVFYRGEWVEGIGAYYVYFPKCSTRKPTHKENISFNKQTYYLSAIKCPMNIPDEDTQEYIRTLLYAIDQEESDFERNDAVKRLQDQTGLQSVVEAYNYLERRRKVKERIHVREEEILTSA